MILTKCVQEAGYHVKPFAFRRRSVRIPDANNPNDVDIALLDKMMPGMNGLELLQAHKEPRALRHIPVIMQTGDAGVAQMRDGLEKGAYYYLTKPFHPEILTALLHSAESECSHARRNAGADDGRATRNSSA